MSVRRSCPWDGGKLRAEYGGNVAFSDDSPQFRQDCPPRQSNGTRVPDWPEN